MTAFWLFYLIMQTKLALFGKQYFKEELNRGASFEFQVPANHPDAQYVENENQVAFKNKDGYFRLFVIKDTNGKDGEDGPYIRAICESSYMELEDEPIEDVRPYDTTEADALDRALVNTRWKRGTIASLEINSTNFYYINVKDAIQSIIDTWGGEFRDRIEFSNNKITGRFIDLLTRRGSDTGKHWEIDKDIMDIEREEKSYVKTALYGRGKSLQTEDGGYTRKITFADVEWSVANGDPVDKPLGQEWVGDPDALLQYGHKNPDGSLRHRYGFYENGEIEDPALLLLDTWGRLQLEKKPLVNFKINGFMLGDLEGYEFEKARLGDTNFAIDRNFANPIEVEVRIISIEYDVSDPDQVGKIEMSEFIDLYDQDIEIEKIKNTLNDREGIWDKVEDPVEVPDTPTLTADGGFQTVILSWTFQNDLFVVTMRFTVPKYEDLRLMLQIYFIEGSHPVFLT
ncbi:phage tail spike protein [Priestia endophytica]|uniref:phage tail spike protein n=1 Tax=Priestia endophytica TaxID=135735 RepID=UPI002280EDE4|nr:phage tail spike protein [Priestia endophytica]MCY8234822.1 phage tail protein [Priestia endophytica]